MHSPSDLDFHPCRVHLAWPHEDRPRIAPARVEAGLPVRPAAATTG